MPKQAQASPEAPTRRSRALAAFPWVLLACALALFGFAAYVSLRYAEVATGATAGAATTGATTTSVWGQYGFLMNGILGPALGFLTVIGLAMTLLMQQNAAAEARREAELLRQEAELRGRPAFLETKLAALSTLINAANHEIYRAGGSAVEQRQLWDDRKKAFLEEMEATFAALKTFDIAQPADAPPDAGNPRV
jgi:hypothetical protein